MSPACRLQSKPTTSVVPGLQTRAPLATGSLPMAPRHVSARSGTAAAQVTGRGFHLRARHSSAGAALAGVDRALPHAVGGRHRRAGGRALADRRRPRPGADHDRLHDPLRADGRSRAAAAGAAIPPSRRCPSAARRGRNSGPPIRPKPCCRGAGEKTATIRSGRQVRQLSHEIVSGISAFGR